MNEPETQQQMAEPLSRADLLLMLEFGDADEGSLRGPVYRDSGGGLGLPTGRVLVRFDSGDAAERHADALAAAGFQLEQVLPYAPHAAWLRAVGGGTVEALKGFPSLRELPGVEHVEPQLIAEASRRE